MYLPPAFTMPSPETQGVVCTFAGLAHVVVAAADGFESSPLPMLWEESTDIGPDEFGPDIGHLGWLVGHVAKPNPIVRLVGDRTVPALVILPGTDAYVSPNYYPSKRVEPRVVPTWNYDMVHVHGRLRLVDDPEWLLALVTRLTNVHEAERAEPWAVADAPNDFIEAMLRGIVGVEVRIERVEGKGKWSQNRRAEDQAGVAAGLRAEGRDTAAARVDG